MVALFPANCSTNSPTIVFGACCPPFIYFEKEASAVIHRKLIVGDSQFLPFKNISHGTDSIQLVRLMGVEIEFHDTVKLKIKCFKMPISE